MRLLAKNDVNSEEETERRKGLAMVHIARKELGLSDILYRELLVVLFNVGTAAALTNKELFDLILFFRQKYNWTPGGNRISGSRDFQIEALRKRAVEFIPKIRDGDRRFKGLCRKLCGVDEIQWCTDARKIKRLLAVLGNIYRKER